MSAADRPTLLLTVHPGTLPRLAALLQRGFLVPCSEPVPLYDFLRDLPGFDREYIKSRIETIFINGSAGDSLGDTLLPGSTVALSAAMPGLAGAIFRKGGVHGSLRSKPARNRSPEATTDGFVTVKLFNMIAADTVEDILPRGILMKGPVLARFFHRQQERLLPLLVDIRQDTNLLGPEEAHLLAESHPIIHFRVIDIPGDC